VEEAAWGSYDAATKRGVAAAKIVGVVWLAYTSGLLCIAEK